MTASTVTETPDTLTRRADQLVPGDRIAAGFLPSAQPAAVLFVHTYVSRNLGEAWVFVAHQEDGYGPSSDYWLAGALIPLEYAADSFGYSRDADDPTPVSPARGVMHAVALEGVATPRTVKASDGDVLVTDQTT
jgi:hypothetical protein